MPWTQSGNTASVDLAAHASDPDGDALTYALVSNSAPGVATAALSGSVLTMTLVAPGLTTVRVSASDGTATTTQDVPFAVQDLLFEDPFAYADGTVLSATADWDYAAAYGDTQAPGVWAGAVSPRLSGNEGAYVSTLTPPDADYAVEMDYVADQGVTNTAALEAQVRLRSGTAGTDEVSLFLNPSALELRLNQRVGGAFTQLAVFPVDVAAEAADAPWAPTVRLEARGSEVRALIDGVPVVPWTSTGVSQVGRAALVVNDETDYVNGGAGAARVAAFRVFSI